MKTSKLRIGILALAFFILHSSFFIGLAQPTPVVKATQAEVDAGVNNSKFVTPLTLQNKPGGGGGGGSATNAVATIKTNGVNVSTGVTSLNFSNGANTTVAGAISAAGAVAITVDSTGGVDETTVTNIFNYMFGTNGGESARIDTVQISYGALRTNTSGSVQILKGIAQVTGGTYPEGGSIRVYADQAGGHSFDLADVAQVYPPTGLTMLLPFSVSISNNAVYYVTNTASGGASAVVYPNEFVQITTLGSGGGGGGSTITGLTQLGTSNETHKPLLLNGTNIYELEAATGITISMTSTSVVINPHISEIITLFNTQPGLTVNVTNVIGLTTNSVISRFDVIANYHGSGDPTTTTGDISSGSRSLVVASTNTFSVGQGVMVRSAGASSWHLTTTITNITGTTMLLSNAASATVSGAVVRHYDLDAINAAIADAANAGGGEVVLGLGLFNIGGPLNPTTGSLITFPQYSSHGVGRNSILSGDGMGFQTNSGKNIGGGGTTLDLTDAQPNPSGSWPSAIAVAPVVLQPPNGNTNFNDINLQVKNLQIVGTNQSKYSGIIMANGVASDVHDCLIYNLSAAAGFEQPTNNTVGIWFPQTGNNIRNTCGTVLVAQFGIGIIPGEHQNFYGMPVSTLNRYGLMLQQSEFDITGEIAIENCLRNFDVFTNGVTRVGVNFGIQTERGSTNVWYRYDIFGADTNSVLHGTLKIFGNTLVDPDPSTAFKIVGGTNLTANNLYYNKTGIGTNNTEPTLDIRQLPDGYSPTVRVAVNPATWEGMEIYATATNHGTSYKQTIPGIGTPSGIESWQQSMSATPVLGFAKGTWFLQAQTAGGAAYVTVPFAADPAGNVFLAAATSGANGNVGIGTTTPAAKLDVSGAIHTTGPITNDSSYYGDGSKLTGINLANGTNTVPAGSLPAGVLTNSDTRAVVFNSTFELTNSVKKSDFLWANDKLTLSSNGVAKIILVSTNGNQTNDGHFYSGLSLNTPGDVTGRDLYVGSGRFLFLRSTARISSPNNNVIGGSFTRLEIGDDSESRSFPALTRTLAGITFTGGDGGSYSSNNIFVPGTVSAGQLSGRTNTIPTIAAGAGAGTSPTVSIQGSDTAGYISITSGTLPSVSSVIATITFGTAFSGTNISVVCWPRNAAASVLTFLPYTVGASSSWTFSAGAVALGGSTAYEYNYQVIGAGQ